MGEFTVRILLSSPAMSLTDVVCRGTCRHRSAEECATERWASAQPGRRARRMVAAGCRLARALDLLHEYDDLSTLALDLGFSSHSHFTATFRQVYGRMPVQLRRALPRR